MAFGLTGLQVFSRISYFPGIAWNTISWRWRNYQWYDRIDSTIVLGALPFRSQAEEVRRRLMKPSSRVKCTIQFLISLHCDAIRL